MRVDKKITEEGREKRNSIKRCKKLISDITKKIKALFKKKETKQLLEGKENIKYGNGLNGLKVIPLSEKSNDEINKIMEEMEKNPMEPQPYSDEQLLEEILRRIGADDELAKMSAENYIVNKIWVYHRIGRLVEQKDGTVIYYDDHKTENGLYRTTIEYANGVITVDSQKYLDDKEGNKVSAPEYYAYYWGDKDGRRVNQVRISKNGFGGITLENNERESIDKFDTTSVIEFDSNHIQVKKIKQILEYDTVIIERTENPFVFKETYQSDTREPLISYIPIEPSRPDQLYSSFYTNARHVRDPKKAAIIGLADINIEELKRRNPKAANYFESLDKEEQKKEELGEE